VSFNYSQSNLLTSARHLTSGRSLHLEYDDLKRLIKIRQGNELISSYFYAYRHLPHLPSHVLSKEKGPISLFYDWRGALAAIEVKDGALIVLSDEMKTPQYTLDIFGNVTGE